MPDHASSSLITTRHCTRCGQEFLCNPVQVDACQCSQVSFSEEEKRFIESQAFSDCLCLDCLKALKEKSHS